MSSSKKRSGTILSYFKKQKNEDDQQQRSQSQINPEETFPALPEVPDPGPSVVQHNLISQNDIGLFHDKQLGDDDRRKILLSPWQPESTFKFPASGKRNLKFQFQWTERWKWLLYSKAKDGAFCKFCLSFSSFGGGRGFQTLGVLVRKPFNRWKDAVEQFNSHENTTYHQNCVVKAQNWLNIETGKQATVEVLQNSALQQQISENRKGVLPIIETIIFCGRQAIALRGHRDSGPIDLNLTPAENEGNFRALLRFRACSGDLALTSHLDTGPRNALYLSPKTQNEVIQACNDILLKKIVAMINDAKCFTILADETTDVSTREQLSIGVRYVHNELVREDFLQFVPVYDLTGKNLANVLLTSLEKFGIQVEYLRGQGYDGASSMSGKFIGTQACVQDVHPTALYVHCASHSLNLAISSSCSVVPIRNCCSTAGKVCVFFNTPKRLEVLKRHIGQKFPDVKATRLKQLCPTRWVERHDAILLLEEMLPAVHEALDEISSWDDVETSSSANQLQSALEQSSFLVSLRVLAKVFSLSLPLCRSLQLENIDLLAAMGMVNILEDQVVQLRTNAETEFGLLYKSVSQLAGQLGVILNQPRKSARQIHRCNVETSTPEEYFRVAVFIPFLDHFSAELKRRFLAHQDILGSFMCLLPKENDENLTKLQEEQLKRLVAFYSNDVRCSELAAVGELTLWYKFSKKLQIAPRKAINYYIACNKDVFPTVSTLLKILCTLPVSTSTSERSFSTLRRLKTYLRNTIGQERLNGLAMLNIHRGTDLTASEVLDELAKTPRRLEFRLN